MKNGILLKYIITISRSSIKFVWKFVHDIVIFTMVIFTSVKLSHRFVIDRIQRLSHCGHKPRSVCQTWGSRHCLCLGYICSFIAGYWWLGTSVIHKSGTCFFARFLRLVLRLNTMISVLSFFLCPLLPRVLSHGTDVRKQFCDVPDSFRPPFSEHHSHICP